ncbi:MAG: Pr6Pr family membrane protein [Nocardioides sp.]
MIDRARAWHLLTALVVAIALVLQTVLVVEGSAVLAEEDPPGLALRLGRLVSYFTIQSNLLVLVAAVTLVRHPQQEGRAWRVLRLAGIAGIAVTGVVHFVLLRPLLDLEGASWVADKLLHMVVPVLALVGWLVFGPRPRIDWVDVGRALVWPFGWLAWTLVVGGATGWYPYPFLDVDEEGWARVLGSCIGITVLFLAVVAGFADLDRRFRRTSG